MVASASPACFPVQLIERVAQHHRLGPRQTEWSSSPSSSTHASGRLLRRRRGFTPESLPVITSTGEPVGLPERAVGQPSTSAPLVRLRSLLGCAPRGRRCLAAEGPMLGGCPFELSADGWPYDSTSSGAPMAPRRSIASTITPTLVSVPIAGSPEPVPSQSGPARRPAPSTSAPALPCPAPRTPGQDAAEHSRRLIAEYCPPGGLVTDPMCGIGTTGGGRRARSTRGRGGARAAVV